jgi:hypothetical protein
MAVIFERDHIDACSSWRPWVQDPATLLIHEFDLASRNDRRPPTCISVLDAVGISAISSRLQRRPPCGSGKPKDAFIMHAAIRQVLECANHHTVRGAALMMVLPHSLEERVVDGERKLKWCNDG